VACKQVELSVTLNYWLATEGLRDSRLQDEKTDPGKRALSCVRLGSCSYLRLIGTIISFPREVSVDQLDRQTVLGEGDRACGTAPAGRMESALRNDVLVAALSNSRAALTRSSLSL